MNQLEQVFNYGDYAVRVKDKQRAVVCGNGRLSVLEINNPSEALRRLEDDEKNTIILTDGKRGNPNKVVVNEAGLYSLILSSRKPEAKAFKRWVTHEILPSINKHGAYMTDNELEQAINDPDFMIGLLTKLKEEKQARLEAETARIEAETKLQLLLEIRLGKR
jgi:anti-repressor protein